MSKPSLFIRTNPQLNGVDYHRLIVPHEKLKEQGLINCDYHPSWEKLARKEFKNDSYNIALFTRMIYSHKHIEKAVDVLKRIHGMKVVLDLDDDYELPKWHPKYKKFIKEENDKDLIASIKHADYIITTQPIIAEKIRQLNKNVVIIPNAIDLEEEQWKDTGIYKESDKVRFGYVGGNTHKLDVMLMSQSIKQVYKEKLNAEFYLCGHDGTEMLDEMEMVFRGRTTANHITKFPVVDIFNYGKFYDLFDVSLAPLRLNEFNSCKSSLKILEAGSKKKPIILSCVAPYLTDILKMADSPLTVFSLDNQSGWYNHIKYYTANPEKIKEDGLNLHEYVKENYDLNKINKYRLEFYESIV